MVPSHLYTVLPAGGAGTRLWPLSRSDRPKFLLDLTGTGRSLIQQTWDRLTHITAPEQIIVVTGKSHATTVAGQLPDLKPENLVAEPFSRDTAPAILLATSLAVRRNPEAIIASFPADHVIQDEVAFRNAVTTAVDAACRGYLVTIGITPSRPSTAYGYIRTGARLLESETSSALHVLKFVEKPDVETAQHYLAEGSWLWNAGMFIVRAEVLLAHTRQMQPSLYDAVSRAADSWNSEKSMEVPDDSWRSVAPISIDHALAEPLALSGQVAVVPAAFGWDDIGDWAALAALLAPKGELAPGVLGDLARVLSVESTGLVVAQSGRRVQVEGLNDVIVVDTPDVLLVISKERAQEVKRIVDDLRERNQLNLL